MISSFIPSTPLNWTSDNPDNDSFDYN